MQFTIIEFFFYCLNNSDKRLKDEKRLHLLLLITTALRSNIAYVLMQLA